MPNSTTSIYTDDEAFSQLIDRMSVDCFDSHRRFCDPNILESGKLESESKSLGPKDWDDLDLCVSKNERSIYTWLRNRTSSIDFGKEIVDKKGKCHPIHINTNQQVLNFFEDLRFDSRAWLKKISNRNFRDHRNEIDTFYFAGNSRPSDPETIVLIDIDCKKFGSLKGALAFAEFLKEHFFPNLYIEVSTHGNGAHGFFVLEKCGCGAEHINDLLLHRLQPWLREVLSENDFDVENVEIKGTLPVIEWGETKYEVLIYKSGTLAKFPRIPTVEDEESLRNTTIVTVNDLQRLPIVEERAKPSSESRQSSGTRQVSGSTTGKHISDGELEEVDGHYRMVAETLMEAHQLKTSGKTVATVEDVAIFLMLLKFFTNNMNPDGSLPVKRWSEMWKSVKDAGDINRAFCCQRFSSIRDHLSKLGLLDWKDESYSIGWTDLDGQYHKGKAAKWKASEELMAMLELPDVSQTEERKKGRTSFIRTTLLNFFKSLTRLTDSETIRPVPVDPEAPFRINPDEIARFITPFESFTGLAA